MNNDMEKRIKQQLSLKNKGILYCSHNDKEVCKDCRKNITGSVSGIIGDVSGIRGDVTDILKVLKEV
jgi:hypothetical protein